MAQGIGASAHLHARLPQGLRLAALSLNASIVALALLGVTVLLHLVSDSSSALIHLFYLPILYAAARHGRLAAILTSTAAGCLIAPWLWASPDSPDPQWIVDWMTRCAMFGAVGLTAAWLGRQQPRPFDQLLRDTVVGSALTRALRRSVITTYFQPVFDIATVQPVGVEALVRWPKDTGGFVPPSTFVPIAEREGVMGQLRTAVMTQAVSQAIEWARAGRPHVLSVNVSALDLADPEFLRDVRAALQRIGDLPVTLCVELTETALMTNRETARQALDQVRAMGVRVALDDFGTGQSSLAYLASLPIDIIKIDRSFIKAATTDEFARTAIQTVVQLARVIKAKTVAEGIETQPQLELVRELGCDLAQGFMLALPVPGPAIKWDAQVQSRS